MADPVTQPAPGAGTKPENGTAPDNGEHASLLASLAEEVQSLKAQNGKLFATLRTMQKPAGQPTEPQQPSEELSTKESLARLQKEIADERRASADERRTATLQSAISSFGLDTDNAELLHDHILQRHGAAIKTIGKSVVYEDPATGEQQTVKDFVGGLLKTKGDRFKPAMQPPTGRGMRAGGNTVPRNFVSYAELDVATRSKMTEQERNEYVRQSMAHLAP